MGYTLTRCVVNPQDTRKGKGVGGGGLFTENLEANFVHKNFWLVIQIIS